jgi:hypothetical protein
MRGLAWEVALIEAVERGSAAAFAYGQNDCLWFVLNAVEAMTGRAPVCPRYKTAKQARVAFGRKGILTLGDYLAANFQELPTPMAAQRGDVGVIAQGDGECCVINIGDCWIGKGETGAVRVRAAAVTRCFKV